MLDTRLHADEETIMAAAGGELLTSAGIFMAATVAVVPLFKRLGLGTVLGYLAAGSLIGPFGLNFISDAESILTVAEFGVVLLLFVIGLELNPDRLWRMRSEIFGLGASQVMLTGIVIAGFAMMFGLPNATGWVVGFGLALSSTAFALQILEERGARSSVYGRRAFSILLFQDLAIVPLLGLVAALNPSSSGDIAWLQIGKMLAVVLGFIFGGRLLLKPIFRLMANTGSREVFGAAALLLVVSAALLMNAVGLSMALGAFLGGVLLAESEFRHQIEADIEPFRALLLSLFFMSVGMMVDWPLVFARFFDVVAIVLGLLVVKFLIIYGLCRLFKSEFADSCRIAGLLPQGGEFAFVIFTAAQGVNLMTNEQSSLLTAAVTLSMAATPLVGLAAEKLIARMPKGHSMDGVAPVDQADQRRVIVAGFGRIGQIVTQLMMARGISVTAIDSNPERIRDAEKFGNKVYYGDIKRLDVLRAAGAGEADLIFVSIHDRRDTNSLVALLRASYPKLRILVRAYDRIHALELLDIGADFVIRETFESSVRLGLEGLRLLETDEDIIDSIGREFRARDQERLMAQRSGDIFAKRDIVFTRFDNVLDALDTKEEQA
ncbi:MAG: monovalent cation:proton antiporter-2 (CPA2) family protein [Pseudomonadota bacterium]